MGPDDVPGPVPGPGMDVGLGPGLVGGAFGAFVTTLVVGAIMVAIAPRYTERRMASLLENPVGSLLYGLLSLGALVLLTFLLVITLVGILLVPFLAMASILVWAIGAAVAYLAIADRLVDRRSGWAKPLVVAAAISGALALTGIGGIVSFFVGAAGFGAVLRSALG
ncbi:hypothetical protein ACFQGT_02490 [Natrialbaceae archaeon GCM10025810]|uniref:hypothetical protein n=1 Tax=Halovalidus salilacus TaxID=3075124 RepID=UPI0036165410